MEVAVKEAEERAVAEKAVLVEGAVVGAVAVLMIVAAAAHVNAMVLPLCSMAPPHYHLHHPLPSCRGDDRSECAP